MKQLYINTLLWLAGLSGDRSVKTLLRLRRELTVERKYSERLKQEIRTLKDRMSDIVRIARAHNPFDPIL